VLRAISESVGERLVIAVRTVGLPRCIGVHPRLKLYQAAE
jgi:hypothetical protein